MKNPLRLGVIGLGFGAKVQLPIFASIEGVRVAAVASTRLETAQTVASGLSECRAFSGWRELLDSEEVDALSIATPPASHFEIASYALERGKHVLLEKPFGSSEREATRLVALSVEHPQLVAAVDFNYRFDLGIAKLIERVASGAIGKVLGIEVSWLTSGRANPALPWSWQNDRAAGGGVVNGFLPHVLDYMMVIGGGEVSKLVGATRITVSERRDAQQRPRAVTAEDYCEGAGTLTTGVAIGFKISNTDPAGSGHRIEVSGSLGRLTMESVWPFGPESTRLSLCLGENQAVPIALAPPQANGAQDTRGTTFREIGMRFVSSIQTGAHDPLLPRFEDGARMQRGLELFRKSLS